MFSQTALTYIATKAYETVIGYPEQGSHYLSAAPQWGVDNEPLALRLLSLQKYNGVLLHPTINLAATPDALDISGQTHEVKSPYTFANTTRFMQLKSTEELLNATPEYFWQVIAQMVAANSKRGYLHVYDARRDVANTIVFEAAHIANHTDTLISRIKAAEIVLQENINAICNICN